jgi:acetyl-CoA C-acetyltransferase
MSFFGGPGNNYTSHGIAAVALKLREGGRLGYVSGNGGVLSKHSIGIYSNEAPAKAFRRVDTTKEQEAIAASALEVALEAYGTATVDGGTVVYGRDGAPASAPIIATLADGRRVVANASPETLPRLAGRTLVGETVSVSGANPPLYSL